MFWKKKPTLEDLISRNPLFAIAFGEVMNSINVELNNHIKFHEYLSDTEITNIINNTYLKTKKGTNQYGGGEVFANVVTQLSDLAAGKSQLDPFSQAAWGLNIARDIIFSHAPAIAISSGKEVEPLTELLLSLIVRNVEQRNLNSETNLIINLLNEIRSKASI